ncbi:hypothetical protein C8R45DRAFT_937263 [Mycena sanguinolenta]|nr:hypothetical protein C8R45DRAFT_937263 [Mycena sanguinolenta]
MQQGVIQRVSRLIELASHRIFFGAAYLVRFKDLGGRSISFCKAEARIDGGIFRTEPHALPPLPPSPLTWLLLQADSNELKTEPRTWRALIKWFRAIGWILPAEKARREGRRHIHFGVSFPPRIWTSLGLIPDALLVAYVLDERRLIYIPYHQASSTPSTTLSPRCNILTSILCPQPWDAVRRHESVTPPLPVSGAKAADAQSCFAPLEERMRAQMAFSIQAENSLAPCAVRLGPAIVILGRCYDDHIRGLKPLRKDMACTIKSISWGEKPSRVWGRHGSDMDFAWPFLHSIHPRLPPARLLLDILGLAFLAVYAGYIHGVARQAFDIKCVSLTSFAEDLCRHIQFLFKTSVASASPDSPPYASSAAAALTGELFLGGSSILGDVHDAPPLSTKSARARVRSADSEILVAAGSRHLWNGTQIARRNALPCDAFLLGYRLSPGDYSQNATRLARGLLRGALDIARAACTPPGGGSGTIATAAGARDEEGSGAKGRGRYGAIRIRDTVACECRIGVRNADPRIPHARCRATRWDGVIASSRTIRGLQSLLSSPVILEAATLRTWLHFARLSSVSEKLIGEYTSTDVRYQHTDRLRPNPSRRHLFTSGTRVNRAPRE